MPSPEQLLELTFPLKGINTETEFQLQPDDTTPIAINVRSIDPVEHRNRGASRCGIRKYVDQKLGLLSLIQHLNVIVDPTIEATLSEVDLEDRLIDNVEDNGSNRRARLMRRGPNYMRTGGNGVRYRKNSQAPRAVDDTINATVGGASVTIQPLDNDTYSGAATFSVVGRSRNFVGSYSVAGPIGGWDFTYTPPATGDAATMRVGYTLTALGNKGKVGARIVINLAAAATFPSLGGSATYSDLIAMRYQNSSDPPSMFGLISNAVGTPSTPEYVVTNLWHFSPPDPEIPPEFNETTSGPTGTFINIAYAGDEIAFDDLYTVYTGPGLESVTVNLQGSYDGDGNFQLDDYDFTSP